MSNKQPLIKITFFLILQLCFSLTCPAQYESDYVREIVKYLGGEREVSVTSGRVDILNDTHAIEVEFANKWKNSIGQSLWYSQQTGLKSSHRWWPDSKALGYNKTDKDKNNKKVYVGLVGKFITIEKNPLATFEIQVKTFKKKSFNHYEDKLLQEMPKSANVISDGSDKYIVFKTIDGSDEDEILKQLEIVYKLVNNL